MTADRPPLVSVAIPLFQSKRFLPHIIQNISSLNYPNVEILVSDRHGLDDSIDRLRGRFSGDSRLRFVQETDRLDWIAHYNRLLREASGKYFMWMPHDDSFPPEYVSQLATALEERPGAALAFGRIEPVDLEDLPLAGARMPIPPLADDRNWSIRDSLKLLFWGAGLPFRGVFRRDAVVGRGLYIRPTRECVGADAYWVFGLSLMAPFVFVESCHCRKRYHSGSTSASFRAGLRHIPDSFRVLRSYLQDLCTSHRDIRIGTAAVLLWNLTCVATLLAVHLPAPVKLPLKRLRRKVLER